MVASSNPQAEHSFSLIMFRVLVLGSLKMREALLSYYEAAKNSKPSKYLFQKRVYLSNQLFFSQVYLYKVLSLNQDSQDVEQTFCTSTIIKDIFSNTYLQIFNHKEVVCN